MQNFSPAARERDVQRIELTQSTMPIHHTEKYTGDWTSSECLDGIRNRHGPFAPSQAVRNSPLPPPRAPSCRRRPPSPRAAPPRVSLLVGSHALTGKFTLQADDSERGYPATVGKFSRSHASHAVRSMTQGRLLNSIFACTCTFKVQIVPSLKVKDHGCRCICTCSRFI